MESNHFVTVYEPPIAESYTHYMDVYHDVSLLWSQAQTKFIEIGRILNVAKRTLPHGEWGKLIENNLPFKKSVAGMLRKIATAVDNKQFKIEELPTDYTAANMLVTAPAKVIEIARERCFIHNRLTRAEIKQFIKKYKVIEHTPVEDGTIIDAEIEIVQYIESNSSRLDDLHKRLSQITEERAKLDEEEAGILFEIKNLEGDQKQLEDHR